MEQFNARNINQLEGFIETPPICNSNVFLGINTFNFPATTNTSSIDLKKHFLDLKHNYVLGKRAETFFELLVNSSKEYEVLTSRLQIAKEKITIGEIDFLLKEKSTDQIVHVELVYKFYIYDPSFSKEINRWIGPNRRDSLLKKIEKLKNHQFPLLFRDETRSALKCLNIEIDNARQEVFFPANLFVPKDLLTIHLPIVNNDCIKGYWIPRKDFNKNNYDGCLFFTPHKQDWPILPHLNKSWLTFEEIKLQVDNLLNRKKAPLIWMKRGGENFERFFVVWW